MALSKVRLRCPYCNDPWQFLRTVLGKTTLVHYCSERKTYVGWFADKDAIPFDVPDKYMEWS